MDICVYKQLLNFLNQFSQLVIRLSDFPNQNISRLLKDNN